MPLSPKGTIHGRTIVLVDDSGLPEGQPVTVAMTPLSEATSPTDSSALAALRRAAGAWTGDDEPGLQHYLEWNRQQRKTDNTKDYQQVPGLSIDDWLIP